ncbi:MAG: glycosyl hydrolase [Saprospiraceae bacterium]|nr:hypothetical protein [Lewinella sp.]
MNPLTRIVSTCLLTTLLFTGYNRTEAQSPHLQDLFQNPPEAAKPRGYWIWGHGNFDYTRIKEELKAFKEMGLGGVDIFDMGIADPLGIIPAGNPFLEEEMLDGVAFAMQEAAKLDLKMGFSVSNGWNAGGRWTEPDEMIMQLLFWKDTIQGPVNLTEIGFPEIPTTFKKPYGTFELFPQTGPDGFPEFYQDVGLVAFPLTRDPVIRDPGAIIYFDPALIAGKQARVELPAGKWVLVRAVVSPLGQKMWMRSDNSEGFIMDHYSKKATKHHFEHVIGKLQERLGNLEDSPLERLYLCSFEAEDYIIWSPELKEEFLAQHGYQLDAYLPVLAGQQVVDKATSNRFLHDYRSTVSEMFVNNHYRQARDICHRNGLLLASESGGPGPPLHYVPTEDLKALGAVDIMRGEFWNQNSEYHDENGNDLLQVVRNIASAAHIYGHKIVEMESFTSHRKHWRESPFQLKKIADRAFCQGMTRVVYHTMPHSPKEAGVPGWSYQAGAHISPKLTWWGMSKPFHSYLARTSALLQAGDFVADVAYYYGEQIPKFASGSKFIRQSLGAGFDYDDLNKEVLLQSTVSEDGSLQLPSGMKYRLLVLPDDPEMSLEVLQKIESLLQQGAVILGNPPTRIPGLKDYKEQEKIVHQLVKKIWGNNKQPITRPYGKGKIIRGKNERMILRDMGILPDFVYDASISARLDYIHRATENEDIYFIRNTDSTELNVLADFRIRNKQPYQFDPATGEISPLALYAEQNDRTQLSLQLSALASTFIVFMPKPADYPPQVVSVTRDGRSVFPSNRALDLSLVYDDRGKINFTANSNASYELTFAGGSTETIREQKQQAPLKIEGPWDVRFPHGWGFTPLQTFDNLIDWTQHPDKELAIFSGTATYRTSFTVNDPAEKYVLDLGHVGEVARVYLNGVEVGTRVFPPYRFELEELIRKGRNYLVIDVANTWQNQLVGEADKPLAEQRTSSNLGYMREPNANIDKSRTETKDERFSRPWRDLPLQASGLMGPVTLQPVVNQRLVK